jgi:hypothetical protein
LKPVVWESNLSSCQVYAHTKRRLPLAARAWLIMMVGLARLWLA